MITWQKQGVIFSVPNNRTQSPTAILLGRMIRIYYSSRIEGKSYIYYIDVDPDTMDIAKYKAEPVLSPGEPGSFDENGCVPGCAVKAGDGISLYYTGFGSEKYVCPYSLSVGWATSMDDGKTFVKQYQKEEIILASDENKWVACAPFKYTEGDSVECGWRNGFYSKGQEWIDGTPVYKIWSQDAHSKESTARPAIVKLGDKYCMWFSYRQAEDFRGGKGSYRIGYAESLDLKTWERDDSKAGIDVGEPGEWDSDMICYPSIVRVNNKLIMLYNGNEFGGTGIGCATYEIKD